MLKCVMMLIIKVMLNVLRLGIHLIISIEHAGYRQTYHLPPTATLLVYHRCTCSDRLTSLYSRSIVYDSKRSRSEPASATGGPGVAGHQASAFFIKYTTQRNRIGDLRARERWVELIDSSFFVYS